MSEKYIKALIKFSEEEGYRKDILDGKLFCRSIKDAATVNDPFDSYASTVRLMFANVRIPFAPDILKPVISFYVVTSDEETDIANINFSEKELEKLSKDFGEYVTVIKDVPRFIEQIKGVNLPVYYGCCDYTNEDVPSNPIFNKKTCCSDEHEFRLMVDNFVCAHDIKGNCLIDEKVLFSYCKDFYVLDRALFLNIGSISDIADTYHMSELKDGIKVRVNFDREKNKVSNLSNLEEYKKTYE